MSLQGLDHTDLPTKQAFRTGVLSMQPTNYFSMACNRTIIVTNIFLKLGILSRFPRPCLSPEKWRMYLNISVTSLQDQNRKNKNNPILYTFKKTFFRALLKSTSVCFKNILVDGCLRLRKINLHKRKWEMFFFFFCFIRRNRFVGSWEKYAWNDRQQHKLKIIWENVWELIIK